MGWGGGGEGGGEKRYTGTPCVVVNLSHAYFCRIKHELHMTNEAAIFL